MTPKGVTDSMKQFLKKNVSYTILTSNACSYCIRKQNEF